MQTIDGRGDFEGFGKLGQSRPRLTLANEPVPHNPQSSDIDIGIAPTNSDLSHDRSTDDGRGSMVLIAELFVYALLITLVAFLWVRG